MRILANALAATAMLSIAMSSPALEFSLAEAQAAWQRGDAETARQHWQALADQGDAAASNNLGHLYENGIGVERDVGKSFALYQRAAEAGIATGQFNLGEAYARGLGTQQDTVEALKWYMLAAAGGDSDATAAVERLQQRLNLDEIGEATLRALDWRRDQHKRKSQP